MENFTIPKVEEAPKYTPPKPSNIELIVRYMQNINNMVGVIDQGDYSKQVKDSSKRIAGKAFDMIIHETSKQTIDKLVMDEYRKNRKLD